MRRLMRKNAQTLMEYTAVITCVIAALLAMRFYTKRAIQGRLRSAADQIGEQYEPGKIEESTMTTTINREVTTEVKTIDTEKEALAEALPLDPLEGKPGYVTLRTEKIIKDETERTGKETVGEFGSGLWE